MMMASIFAGLPNDLIINIININTTNMTAEKHEIKNKLKLCMEDIQNVAFAYSPNYQPEHHKDKAVFYKVSKEYWDSNIYDDTDEEDDDDDDY